MRAHPGRGEWGCVLLSTSLASDLWALKGSALPKLSRWLQAGCMQALGWWIGMPELYGAIRSFWVIQAVEVISQCHLILWMMCLDPKSLCLLWPGQVVGSRRRRVWWKAWGKGRAKGDLVQEGEQPSFRGGIEQFLQTVTWHLFQTARANAARRNKTAHLVFITDLKR